MLAIYTAMVSSVALVQAGEKHVRDSDKMSGARIITVPVGVGGGSGGIRCCSCVHLEVLKTTPGRLKLAEVILAMLCQTLLLGYGYHHIPILGAIYSGLLTAISSCLLTSAILLFCYVFSYKSLGLLRSSLFETVFNAFAAFLYLSSSSCLSYWVIVFLWPLYLITPFFQVYPAMTAIYIMGIILGVLHAYDAYLAYKQFNGYT